MMKLSKNQKVELEKLANNNGFANTAKGLILVARDYGKFVAGLGASVMLAATAFSEEVDRVEDIIAYSDGVDEDVEDVEGPLGPNDVW